MEAAAAQVLFTEEGVRPTAATGHTVEVRGHQQCRRRCPPRTLEAVVEVLSRAMMPRLVSSPSAR